MLLKKAIIEKVMEMVKVASKHDIPDKLRPGNYIFIDGGESGYDKIFSKFQPNFLMADLNLFNRCRLR